MCVCVCCVLKALTKEEGSDVRERNERGDECSALSTLLTAIEGRNKVVDRAKSKFHHDISL